MLSQIETLNKHFIGLAACGSCMYDQEAHLAALEMAVAVQWLAENADESHTAEYWLRAAEEYASDSLYIKGCMEVIEEGMKDEGEEVH